MVIVEMSGMVVGMMFVLGWGVLVVHVLSLQSVMRYIGDSGITRGNEDIDWGWWS